MSTPNQLQLEQQLKDKDDLINWFTSNKGTINNNLQIEYSNESGYNVKLTKDIKDLDINTNDPLITVPKDLTINIDLALDFFKDNKDYSIEFPSSKDKNRNKVLKLFLCKLYYSYQSNSPLTDNSNRDLVEFYKPYLNILPNSLRKIGHLPYTFNLSEKKLFENTDLLYFTRLNLDSILDEWSDLISSINTSNESEQSKINNDLKNYLKLKESVQDNQDISLFLTNELTGAGNTNFTSWTNFPIYLWSHCILTSRSFPNLLFNNDSKNSSLSDCVLIPIFDLINHSNDSNIKWENDDSNNQIIFKSNDFNKSIINNELFNNYGEKSNIDLLLYYGFLIDHNKFDNTFLTLKVDENSIELSKKLKINLPDINLTNNAINFEINYNNPLPLNLVDFLSSLMQLKSENNLFTLRMKLNGLSKLKELIENKISLLKTSANERTKKDIENEEFITDLKLIKLSKIFKNNQKLLFQKTLEEIDKLIKNLIKSYKPLSFKSIFKNDKQFVNSLLLTFGVTNYDDLIKKNLLDQSLLLYIVRISNLTPNDIKPELKFIKNHFVDIKNSISITKEDVLEYKDFYNFLFPSLSEKIPEIYKKGDWSIKSFIIAGTVIDRIKFLRTASNELYLIEKIEVPVSNND
ncbi:unnamed protein product [[Candida] boidinii]|nr:unnamed protein product [[Candida] boidinii]